MDFQKKLWYDRQKNERNYEIEKLSAYQVLEILFPVAFHYGMMLLAAMLTGNFLDAASQTTLAALLAFLFYGFFKKKSRSQKKYSAVPSGFCLLWEWLGTPCFSLILNAVHLTEHFSNASQEALFQSNLLVQIIGIGLFVPFVEELVFRGLVYGKMRRLFSFRAAAAVSAALFALYHGNIVQLVYAFPMGLLLAWSYERWENLSAPVLLHIGANLLGILETVIRGFSIR